jgi:hypothetical protein
MLKQLTIAAACGLAAVCSWQPSARAVVLEPSADANVEEHTPDSDDTTQPRIQVRSRDVADSGRQNVGYFQFDLTGVSSVPNAIFSTTMQSSTPSAAGANQVFGLIEFAGNGNTAQNWTNLTYNTTGAELPGDGDPTTQDLGLIGTDLTMDNLYPIGDLPEITGMAEEVISINGTSNPGLVDFLNTRVGGLATLLIVQSNAVDNELLFNSVEDVEGLRPTLEIVPEPANGLLGLWLAIQLAYLRRRAVH